MKTKPLCEGECSSLDRISTLPQTILETILCRLPTKEAARTSVLSREWRYKWTTIPKLEFYHRDGRSVFDQAPNIARNQDMRCKPCYNIQQILLSHQGPIHELSIYPLKYNCLELDQIILNLSRNHPVKKLALGGWDIEACGYKLPISVFSFLHLTDLDLFCVDLDHPPTFNGFGSLRSLSLHEVEISTKSLLHLLSNCPSLKSFTLFIADAHVGGEKCNIIELFKCLPAVEHLTTWLNVSAWLVLDPVPQELPTSLFHLKYFRFENISRVDGYGLGFLLVLLKCSPNLETIKLESEDYFEEYSVVWEEYSDVWLEHLKELEIDCFWNTKPEMDFVKFILARSPRLEKVSIGSAVDGDEKLKMVEVLLQAPRLSPVLIYV